MQTWERRRWSAEADQALGDLIRGNRDLILDAIDCGAAELWKISSDTGAGGWLITQCRGDELELIAGRGRGMADLLPTIKRAAKNSGCRQIRIHSHRKGYERFIRRFGFELIERHQGEGIFRYVLK